MSKTKKDSSIILFNQSQVRRKWDDKKELWYFSIIDVVKILTNEITKAWTDRSVKSYN